MRNHHFILTSITALSLAASAWCQDGLAVDLFNGKNLKGWQSYLSEHGVMKGKVWSVRDGLLVCQGEPMGYLYTRKGFTNFRLVVEWRWAPGRKPGNSGVLLRIGGEPRPLPRCIEAQLQSGSAGDMYGFQGMKIDGDASRKGEVADHKLGGHLTSLKKITGNEKEPGEWNRYEILVKGPKITLHVNGQKVNEASGCEVVEGPIGLQSEGAEIHFRKVTLTPMD